MGIPFMSSGLFEKRAKQTKNPRPKKVAKKGSPVERFDL